MPVLIVEGRKYRLGDVAGEDRFWNVPIDEKTVALEVLRQPSAQLPTLFARARGKVISVSLQDHRDQRTYSVEVNGRPLTITLEEDAPSDPTVDSRTTHGPVVVSSPMAGKIASVKTSVDSKVEEGQPLMILEAMKMQNEIASPKSGILKELYVKPGDLVKAGDRLCLVV
ncbi:MAG TPA: biotin/lipoyl-containing protein [Candidatus Angelobacter sp.]|nr:biotin/lipoyl-containing protein [Candidatus Angelobacter sp.]